MNRLVFYSRRYLIIAAWVVVSTLGLSVFSHDQANAASYPKYTYNTDGSFIISGGSLSEILNSGSSIEVKLDVGVWKAIFQVKSDSSCASNQAHIRLTANGVTEPGDSIVTDVLVECLEGNKLEIGGVDYGDQMEYWTDGNQKVIKPTATTPPGQPGPVKPPGIDGDELFRFLHEKDPTGQYIIACVGMFKQFSGIGAPGTDLEGCFEFSEGTAPGEDPTLTWERVLNVNNPALYGCGGAGVKSYRFTITVDTPPSMNDVGAVPGTLTVKPATHTANCTDLDLKSAADGMPIEIMGGQDLESLLGMPVEVVGEYDDSMCQVSGGLGYILCPLMNTVADINDKAFQAIKVFLVIPPMMTQAGDNGAYDIWRQIRNIANVMFGLVFLVIIYSQLTSAGISNYGIKKMLPKLLVGIILVNTSYWIVAIGVDLSNLVGVSIYNVLDGMSRGSEPPSWGSATAGVLAGTAVTAGAVVIGVMLGLTILLPLLVSGVFMLGGLMFVLTFRHAMIFILAVVSPLAFVAYLLPNTDGMFKAWSKLLKVLLYIFPVVAFVMGASNVAAAITFAAAQSAGGVSGVIMMLIAVAMPAMGIFAALMLARTMGSIMSKFGISNPLSGAVNAAKDGVRKFGQRQDEINATSALTGEGGRFRRGIGMVSGARRRARSEAKNAAASRNKTLASQSYIADSVGDGAKGSLLNRLTDGKLGSDNALASQLSAGMGDKGRLRVIAEAKAVESKELMNDIDNIMSTIDKETASNPIELQARFKIATENNNLAEMAAYQKLMVRNGSAGVNQARESLAEFTNTSGLSEESLGRREKQIMNLKDILAGDDTFQGAGRDFEVWSNNEHTVETGKVDAQGNPIKVPHANFDSVTNDMKVWEDISAQRFASMNTASQNKMLDLLYGMGPDNKRNKVPPAENREKVEAFIGRMRRDSTAMGRLKEGPLKTILEYNLPPDPKSTTQQAPTINPQSQRDPSTVSLRGGETTTGSGLIIPRNLKK